MSSSAVANSLPYHVYTRLLEQKKPVAVVNTVSTTPPWNSMKVGDACFDRERLVVKDGTTTNAFDSQLCSEPIKKGTLTLDTAAAGEFRVIAEGIGKEFRNGLWRIHIRSVGSATGGCVELRLTGAGTSHCHLYVVSSNIASFLFSEIHAGWYDSAYRVIGKTNASKNGVPWAISVTSETGDPLASVTIGTGAGPSVTDLTDFSCTIPSSYPAVSTGISTDAHKIVVLDAEGRPSLCPVPLPTPGTSSANKVVTADSSGNWQLTTLPDKLINGQHLQPPVDLGRNHYLLAPVDGYVAVWEGIALPQDDSGEILFRVMKKGGAALAGGDYVEGFLLEQCIRPDWDTDGWHAQGRANTAAQEYADGFMRMTHKAVKSNFPIWLRFEIDCKSRTLAEGILLHYSWLGQWQAGERGRAEAHFMLPPTPTGIDGVYLTEYVDHHIEYVGMAWYE